MITRKKLGADSPGLPCLDSARNSLITELHFPAAPAPTGTADARPTRQLSASADKMEAGLSHLRGKVL